MFSRKKDPVTPTALPANPPSITKATSTLSIISPDVSITGDLVSLGDVQIEGAVNGNLRARGIVVGGEANIHGEVAAEEVIVRGYVKGEIRGDRVTLAPGCLVIGNIYHKLLTIETGADFDGRCTRCEDPLAKAAAGQEVHTAPEPVVNTGMPRAEPPRAVVGMNKSPIVHSYAEEVETYTEEAEIEEQATVVDLLSDEIDELEGELNAARAAKAAEETAPMPKTRRRVIGTHLAPRPAYAGRSAG